MSAPWHDEARRLRATGMTYLAIANQLGKAETTICRAISERTKESQRRYRKVNFYGVSPAKPAVPQKQKPTVKTISPEVKWAAIMAYHNKQIDRHEMMRRITPP